MKIAPSEDDDECCVSEKFQKRVSTLPRFLHRGAAGNMEPLTGDVAGRIRRGDRRLLMLVRSNLKKFSKVVSKKLEFGHLKVKGENDDDPRAEKNFRRWCHFDRFFTCRGEGCLAKCTTSSYALLSLASFVRYCLYLFSCICSFSASLSLAGMPQGPRTA